MEVGNVIRDQVKAVLMRHKRARDSDQLLAYHLLMNYYANPNYLTVTEYLRGVDHRVLPSMEAIVRARRKVQEEYPDLRGELYEERQKHVPVVQETLGYQVKQNKQPANQMSLL